MSEHPNASRIRALFRAFRERDLRAISDAVPEQAVWHFPGRAGKLAGTHAGKGAILAFLGKVSQLTRGSFRFDLEDVIANESHAVAFFRGQAEREGRVLDNPTCLKIRLEGGRIVEVWEFVWDLPAVEEFWS